MTNEEKKLKELYIMAELAYKKQFSESFKDKEDIFPIDWYKNKDYKNKIELIYNSIKKNVLLEHNDLYKRKYLDYKD